MNQVWTMEDANLFCGKGPNDNTSSNHLILTELKLPGLDTQYVDHRAGGAPVAIEIDTVIAKLECTFALLGMTPQVMKLLGSWGPDKNTFSAFGVIRDNVTGEVAQAQAIIVGQLGRSDPTNWRRGDVLHTNYSIRGIVHYELNIAGDPIYEWDFATNTRIIGGIDQNRVINNLLHINATAAQSLIVSGEGGFQPGE